MTCAKIHIHSTLKCIYSLKTPSFKNGELKVKCECEECFMKLRVVALLELKVDYSLVRITMVVESGNLVGLS